MNPNSKGKQVERERSISVVSIKSSNHSDQFRVPSQPQPHHLRSQHPSTDGYPNSNPYTYDHNQDPERRRMMIVGGRESSVSSSIAAAQGIPNRNPNLPSSSWMNRQSSSNQYQSYPHRSMPGGGVGGPAPMYPPSISARSDLDLVGDGPPVGLVRPPPTISSDGGLNNAETDRGLGDEEEEGDGQPPLIFHCKKCGKVIGDTWSWVTARTDMRIVVLATVTDVVTAREDSYTSKDAGPLAGSPHTVVGCSNCNVTLGKIYRMTPRERDDLRDAYSLDVDALSIYPVGSANQSARSIPPEAALRLTPGSFPAPTSAASNEAAAAAAGTNGSAIASGHAPATFHELSQLRMLVMTMGERMVKLEQRVEFLESSSTSGINKHGSGSTLGSNTNGPTKTSVVQSKQTGSTNRVQPQPHVTPNLQTQATSGWATKSIPNAAKAQSSPLHKPSKDSGNRKPQTKVNPSSSGSESTSKTSSTRASKRKKSNDEPKVEEKVESKEESRNLKRKQAKNTDLDQAGENEEEEDDFDADPAEAYEFGPKSPRAKNKSGDVAKVNRSGAKNGAKEKARGR